VIAESVRQRGLASDSAWRMLLAASALANTLEQEDQTRLFAEDSRADFGRCRLTVRMRTWPGTPAGGGSAGCLSTIRDASS
jgi:hypothetical protein